MILEFNKRVLEKRDEVISKNIKGTVMTHFKEPGGTEHTLDVILE